MKKNRLVILVSDPETGMHVEKRTASGMDMARRFSFMYRFCSIPGELFERYERADKAYREVNAELRKIWDGLPPAHGDKP